MTTDSRMVCRFITGYDDDDETKWCKDRLTGEYVFQYDYCDPANYNPTHGGVPDNERMRSLGYTELDEIKFTDSKLLVTQADVDSWAVTKERILERNRLGAEAKDLLEFLGSAADKFDYSEYFVGERDILKPALTALGYECIVFFDIERDSFGPLTRGCSATKDGVEQRFYYG